LLTTVEQQLEELFKSRYHGAVNIRGIRYQIAYSLLRAFDLYEGDQNGSIRLEGIDDLDVNGSREVEAKGFHVGSEYVQVKTSKTDWDWGRFAESNIIENFLPVWFADPSARLLVVTNFGYAGKLAELVESCYGQRKVPSTKLKTSIYKLCQRAGFPRRDPIELIERISFERISDEQVYLRTISAIHQRFDLETGNTDLYLLVLMTKFLDFAVERKEIGRTDIEEIRLFIQENIDLGTKNPAIQNGWIERLKFNPDPQAADYYEGTNARPGHILAGLDAERPVWLDRIHRALERTGMCVLRTSSGQGKSTLLFRYAFEHYQPETTFIVKHLSEEAMVGPVKQAIMARRALGLPILVLIDNVRSGLRYWHNLAAELEGHKITVLVTTREEDWYRYSGQISAFNWEIVAPNLSLSEARQIHKAFKEKNRVAASVPSAEWAFEQVSERKLLIEFTYLITHGQMLAERLSDQVREMEHLKEDHAKLHVLRLVSVAQTYDASVVIGSILKQVKFEADPDSTLASLQGEYVLCNEGRCEGLHFIRSQHLVHLLHKVIPLEETVAELISILDVENLEAFVRSAFLDDALNRPRLLRVLIDRCRKESLESATRIAKALYTVSETLYCRAHQTQFDEAISKLGTGVTIMLCLATLPFQLVDTIADLQKTLPDNPNLKLLSDVARTFIPRRWEDRVEVRFLQGIIDDVRLDRLRTDFWALGSFLYWCRLPTLNTSRIEKLLYGTDWTEELADADLAATADFLYELRQFASEKYDALVSDRRAVMSRFKLLTETLLVEERGENIYIEFIVDESAESKRPNEQAWERLRDLHKLLPDYHDYCSQGLYINEYGLQRPVDDTHKEAEEAFLKKEIEGRRNAPYIDAVDARYATKFVYQWQEQWFNFRHDLNGWMRHLLRFFQNGSASNNLNEEWRELTNRLSHALPLPDNVRQALPNEDKRIKEWSTALGNFLNQLAQSEDDSRLMRHNLRAALQHLPNAQIAFEKVVAYTEKYFDLASLSPGEAETYEDVADVLDLRFEQPERPLLDWRRLVKDRRQRSRQEFVSAVNNALVPLEQQGLVFTYPQDRLIEFPLISVCVGFEVMDFEFLIEQMAVIVSRFESFPVEYDFLCLIPTLEGASYTSNVWRISRDSITKVLAGEAKDDPWVLLPVDRTQNVAQVLPTLKQATLAEFDFYNEFYKVYAELNAVRNTIYLVNNRLDPIEADEVELRNRHQQRVQKTVDTIKERFSHLAKRMFEYVARDSEISHSIGRVAWMDFCQRCSEKFNELLERIDDIDPSTFKSIELLQDKELEKLFGRYLNAKYIGSS
jgi:hypothetical protein